MKILVINDNTNLKGGAERAISNLIANLRKYDHDVNFLGFRSPKEDNRLIDKRQYGLNESRFFLFRLLGRMVISLRLYLQLRKMVKIINPDIIDVHSNYKYPLTVLLACNGYPKVKTIHDFGFLCLGIDGITKDGKEICAKGISIHCLLNGCVSLKKFLALYLSQKIYKSVEKRSFSAFITMNQLFYNYLNNLGYQNVFYLPNSLNEELLEKINQSESPKKINNEATICYMGNLGKHKGVNLLIKAMPTVLQNVHAQLKIIGEGVKNNDTNKPLLEQLSKQLKLENYIDFMGRLSYQSTLEILKGSNVLVLPSKCIENCPLVILEAMALGVPVVASNIGGIPELIKDGKTGFLFKPGDPQDLADKIIKLLNNPSFEKKMGKHAQELYNRKYAPEKHYVRLMKIYKHALLSKNHEVF